MVVIISTCYRLSTCDNNCKCVYVYACVFTHVTVLSVTGPKMNKGVYITLSTQSVGPS